MALILEKDGDIVNCWLRFASEERTNYVKVI